MQVASYRSIQTAGLGIFPCPGSFQKAAEITVMDRIGRVLLTTFVSMRFLFQCDGEQNPAVFLSGGSEKRANNNNNNSK